jgi:hypothetical protein
MKRALVCLQFFFYLFDEKLLLLGREAKTNRMATRKKEESERVE